MTIQIVVTRPSPAETGGGMWNVGQTKTVSDSYALTLIGRGDAYAVDGSLVDVQAPVIYTWATLPAPSAYIGLAFVADIGARGSLWRSNGATWGIVGGSVVLSAYAVARAAITGTTTEQAEVTYSLAASPGAGPLLGLDGWLDLEIAVTTTNNANTKTYRARLGGAGITGSLVWNSLSISYASLVTGCRISARGSHTAQLGCSSVARYGGSTGAINTAAVDMTTAQLLSLTTQLANAGDSSVLEAHRITLYRP